MPHIKLLDKNISELIAAGEVIERPASIVKELVENSIDAGSTAITVEIRRGGISYIRITDNGCGIHPEDMPTAFKRHATSKITDSDDLENIATLGFRGEALASISAVSRVEMTSKTLSDEFGTRVVIEADEVISTEAAGSSTGTTIIVRDLFFNVPARLKFLKKDQAEANVICGMVDKLALSHPEVSFKLISDNKVRLHTSGNGDMLSAIHSVLGKDFASALIPVDYQLENTKVSGYISKTTVSRSNRAMQHFFVNERYVRSKTCIAAIEEGYKNSLMTGKYPFCVLDIKLPFNMVDVNVHPAKIEVRFVNERIVFDTVYFAVKSALSLNDQLAAAVRTGSSEIEMKKPMSKNVLSGFRGEAAQQLTIEEGNGLAADVLHGSDKSYMLEEEQPDVEKSINYTQDILFKEQTAELMLCDKPKEHSYSIGRSYDCSVEVDKADFEEFNFISKDKLISSENNSRPVIKREAPLNKANDDDLTDSDEQNVTADLPSEAEKVSTDLNQENIDASTASMPMKIIGELFKTYVLFEVEDKLIMLDKHAAHERILYNKLKQSISAEQSQRQILLKPVIINLSTDEFNVLLENQDTLGEMGFCYEEFGNHTIALREVPLMLVGYDYQDILLDIANKLVLKKHDASSERLEHILHSIACRSAVKANDNNSLEELESLMRAVLMDSDVRHCPHGRPVFTILTKYEIEKMFGRS